MNILVTGGAGFIGSALCHSLIDNTNHHVVNVDKLTYAANPASLDRLHRHPRYRFFQVDISDTEALAEILSKASIQIIMHLAAETHADRSIDGPAAFVQTNVIGTFQLLEAARSYWVDLPPARRQAFRFHHVSTDEVYGDLPYDETVFTEEAAFAPSSPYSASKAASNHLVMAWHRTYGLPVVISNGSNTYGPRHFPEKLIPLTILNALEGRAIDVYGDGQNVRDWLYVDDHVRALESVAMRGAIGHSYNVGSGHPKTNLSVVQAICDLVDRLAPHPALPNRRDLIRFVTDRPGHDRRYALDTSYIQADLGWKSSVNFENGLEKTVRWFLDHSEWWSPVRQASYAGHRLGLLNANVSD